VAGLGQCSLDYLCRIPAYPACDTKCEFNAFAIQGGGPVATALVLLSRWGVRTRFAGVIGTDDFGSRILDGLRRDKVDCSATIVRQKARSQFAFICVEQETGKRTIFWGRPTAGPYQPSELPDQFLQGVHALHLDGLFARASIHLAHRARGLGIPVVLDAGSLRPGMLELVRLTDHLIASERFARQFDPRGSVDHVVRKLGTLGPSVVTVTMGEHGSVSFWRGADRPCYLPALPVRPYDTTGAGDIFHGAYLYGLLKQWPVPACLRWATVSAGLSCTRLGGRAGIPSRQAVRQGLKSLPDFSVRPSRAHG